MARDLRYNTPSWEELRALLKSARRRRHTPSGDELWTVARLARELATYQQDGPEQIDPELRAALGTIKGSTVGAELKAHWQASTIYGHENQARGTVPSREFVWLYDLMFNAGQGGLLNRYEECRVARPPRSVPSRPATKYPLPGDRTVFVTDVTVRDFMLLPVNYQFTKTWRLLNAGTVPWIGRRLARVGMVTGWGAIRSEPWVPIQDTHPGQMVDITVELRAPTVATTETEARWRMVDQDGEMFFPATPYGIGLVISAADNVIEPQTLDLVNSGQLTALVCQSKTGGGCLRVVP